mgnify:CR=1 FL=1
MGYLGLENDSVGVNVKHEKLGIELAVQGWYLATNVEDTSKSIEEGLIFARDEGKSPDLETRVEDIAYYAYGRVTDGKAIYYKGKNVMPTIPAEIVEEARMYLSMEQSVQSAFLLDFYRQIVLGKEGAYAEKFAEGKLETTAISNYFADKMRDLGLTALADKLEAKIREMFPKQGMNVYLHEIPA